MWCLVTRSQQCHQPEEWAAERDKSRAVSPKPEMNCSILWSYWVSKDTIQYSSTCESASVSKQQPSSDSLPYHTGAESREALSPQDGTEPSAADGALIIPS